MTPGGVPWLTFLDDSSGLRGLGEEDSGGGFRKAVVVQRQRIRMRQSWIPLPLSAVLDVNSNVCMA
jgi:hypothetical protein